MSQDNNAGQPFQPQAGPGWPVAGYPDGGQPAGGHRAPDQPRKSRTGLIVGSVVAGVLALCCFGGGAAVLGSAGEESAKPAAAVASSKPATAPATSAPPSIAPATTAPAPQPESDTMGLPLGTTVTATTYAGAVEITVTKSRKYPKPRKSACNDFMPDPDQGYYLVLDVKVQVVSGEGSINPLDFTFVDGDGATASGISGAFSGCGKLMDSGNHFPAGTKRSGQLMFDVPTAKGAVEYGTTTPLASWQVS